MITQLMLSLLVMTGFLLTSEAIAANELSLGKSSKVAGPIDIPIVPPADFNFKSRAEILQMRQREVLKHPELLKGTYVPDKDVFGQMVDGKPWWGTLGEAFYGRGEKSIRGEAEESRFILNPFLLAGEPSIAGFDKSIVTESAAISRRFPLFYKPTGLRWWPKEGKAQVTYEITAYKNEMRFKLALSQFTVNPNLHLEVINARDLGLAYFYIPPAWAYNIGMSSPMSGPKLIPQYIHCGGSCGYPGGCNNMSPAFADLDSFTFTSLPARLCLMFWKHAPATGKEKPDMIYMINYR
jgi:hypothetical protein